ncbi:phage tail protein [Salmonella enterica]|nr:phage tail protein [Salmonella enterica]EBM9642204.1 phage tail protein [Salmonella enterica subsp. enterica serovar Agona]EBN0169004.1 phage tail protein [Salmonella enterica subsp. enterica serovar Infantis]ECI8489041.1 phage tail protein [Salmonella enterica subsp. enterica serovar Muenchen]EDL3542371.1 phage tail protein [Salmonella enterica subsp. enterica serovar Newport]EDS2677330.1 phage tail protein [Salmonella enterica subsp. enterica serovar 4,[5],12:i:-]EDT7305764.1 phage tail 
MTVKYYAILTNQGAARLANATMLGSKLNLTQMAVGDANGVLPTPDPAQTKLINQKRIAPLNLLSVDPNNQSQIIAEQIIPENEGGFWIREIGLYDDEGVLIAVANCPETYKPQLQEGSGRTQTIRMILVVTNTEAITLKIDPSVVLATRKYVDDEVLELRLYVDDQMRNHIAAQDPHTQYAQKHNPTFTGEPKAPTPAAGNNTTRIATTEFVQAAITALINGAPATLDTLKEIAAAINNDPKFSATINNALSGKQPLDETLTHLSGKDVAGLLAYLGLGETINLAKNAVPATRRVNSKPLTGDITLSAADVNAFALGMTGDTLENNKSVGWNWKSGVYNVPTGGASKLILHFNMNIGSCPAVQFCVNYKNGGISYRSARDDFGFELDWTEFYTTTRKPSAGDVGALPVSGGVINGNLGIGTPNILGGSSIVLGDNDTGLKQNGDGLLDIYANGVQVFRFQNDTLESKKSINVTGRLTPTDYGNFDCRYVQDFRLGSYESGQAWMGPGFSDTPGYVLTAATNGNGDELIDSLGRRPMQKLIGNQWYNVTSV